MDAPVIHKPHPSLFPVTILAGFVATVLVTALIHLAPVLGFPYIDLPRLIGGLFSGDPSTAFGAGHLIFVFGGVFVFALALSILWAQLPGDEISFRGALVKGVVWGVFLWALSGLLLPLLGALNQVEGANPGLFALAHGALGPLWLLSLQLLYGVSLALVAAMARGLQPLDSLGWMWTSHGSGESP